MKTHRPPRWAERLFIWYCGVAKVDDLQGDIEELFYQNLKRKSLWAARLIYWRHVLVLMSSYAVSKRMRDARFHPLSSSNNLSLIENYFKVAFRNIVKQKYFATINIVGLAIGMSASLLLIALLSYAASYDKSHQRGKDIYRVTTTRNDNVSNRQYASAPLPLVAKLGAEFPGIEKMVRVNKGFHDEAVTSGGAVPLSGYYTDPPFLQVFTFPLVSGNPRTALVQPGNIVLTAAAAMKLFNSTDVLGKIVQFESGGNFEVTGIVGDPPKNSHLQFEALVSYASRPVPEARQKVDEEWIDFRDNYLYLIVSSPAVGGLQEYLNSISMVIPGDNAPVHLSFELQALLDIVPGPDMFNQIGPDWDYTSFAIFGTLCLCILLPACFNYANISIARALKRSKEIGLRKTLGSLRQQIFFQFITETVIITLLSLIGGILIFLLIRSEFHSMLVSASVLDLSLTPAMILYFFVFAVTTGFVAGVMPAIYFSKISPMEALKNQHALKLFSGKRIRTALIVLQFAMSLTFILSIVVISKQYRYALNFDLGFSQENILDVELHGTDPEVFRSEFSRLSSVQSISMSSGVLGTSYPQTWIKEPGRMDSSEVFQMFVDEHYLSNVGLKLLAGRNFGQSPHSGERHIIVNEEFLNIRQITDPGAALGQSFVIDSLELEIVGVVKNFHFMNLKQPVRAFLFRSSADQYKLANVRIQSNDLEQTFSAMEAAWKTLGNGHKMEARFFEDEIEDAYISYKVMLKIFGFLGLLAISISCLGLLGMVVYTAETKTKEVSIRKIMGATTLNLALLLSSSYLKLLLVGAAFAIPITWLAFDKFLSVISYYRVTITILDVAFSVLILLALGLGTMGWQTMKTAIANPADTLKYE